ncbi:sulfotransferase family protein [Mechercharimyces sp. CAU 1602]|uniref:sulfotransferase family protein n=1 Tax=Mechercharimyces sp. CAU 1602 TaxID=2973933 RepID=UPI002161D43E|nr:sulfotransferase family protein [Mechercharimyces sp. CAU 1602]MCS1350268.1 sulfotransferase family protein [Mechercharimyces sp. CAU 1602]
MRRTLIFSHIPKTGGSTLTQILKKKMGRSNSLHYPAHEKAHLLKKLSPAYKRRIHFVYGHCRFGCHRYFRSPYTYITLLRDPIDRVISTYYFIRSQPQNPHYEIAQSLTLEQYVNWHDPNITQQITNHQTRFLSGKSEPCLMLAKKHLQTHYLLVGLTERYVETVFLLHKKCNWKLSSYTKENVNHTRPPRSAVPQSIIDKIVALNQLDLQLYQYAQSRFEQQLQQLSLAHQEKLQQYKKHIQLLSST